MSAEEPFWNPRRAQSPEPCLPAASLSASPVSHDPEPRTFDASSDKESVSRTSELRMAGADLASHGEEARVPGAPSKTGSASLVATANKKLLKELSDNLQEESKKSAFAIGGFIPILDPDVVDHRMSEGCQTSSGVGSICSDKDMPTSNTIILRWDSKNEIIPSANRIAFPVVQGAHESLTKLVSDCEPAGFGRGNADVFDETYRKAGKLDTTSFCSDFDPHNLGIIDSISRILLPALSGEKMTRTVRAELYKLNVYSGPSGKFKPHVDTPRSASQFGSLVVCLPCRHDGGQLIVRHSNDSVVFDWSTEVAANSIAWAAFYSDCEHEVLEVTDGHRVTLTYNLYVASTDIPKNLLSALDPTSLPLYAKICNLLAQPGFMQEGGILGFYCVHAYAHTSATMINHLPWGLKGVDMTAYQAFEAAGLSVESRPVVNLDPRNDRPDECEIADFLGLRWDEWKWGDPWAWINDHESKDTPKGATKQDIADRAKFLAQYHSKHPGRGAVFVGDKFRETVVTEKGGYVDSCFFDICKEGLKKFDFLKIEWLNEKRNPQRSIVHLTYGNEAGSVLMVAFRLTPLDGERSDGFSPGC